MPGAPSHGVRGFLDMAVESVAGADDTLAELQDSMLPVEVGDAELRAGLADVREHVGALRAECARAGAHPRSLSRGFRPGEPAANPAAWADVP